MKTKLLILPLLLAALTAFGQSVPVEIEIGYRVSEIDGNEDLYRAQLNERDGVIIRSLTFFTPALGGAADHFRLDATDLGAGPSSVVRIDTGRTDAYRLQLGYRTFDSFNAVPSFGLHTFDRQRTMFDADLELLTFSRFTPFVGYSWSRNEGPGTSTYFLGGDEFRLGSDLEETDRELRVGTAFTFSKLSGSITQGWRDLSSKEQMTLTAGAGAGNNLGSILGKNITADSITRDSNVDVSTPFTNLYVMSDAIPRVRLIGDYAKFSAEADGLELENAAGSFVSFALGGFFTGLGETTASRAQNDTWRGGARAEVAITDTMTFEAGWRAENRELQGAAVINSLFRDSVAFGATSLATITEILETDSSFARDEKIGSVAFAARAIGPFTVRVGYSIADQDISIAPDLAEIVVPGSQGGDFDRRVRTLDATATFAKKYVTVTGSWRGDDANRALLRTDFTDRQRVRVRALFRTPSDRFRIGITSDTTDQNNDTAGVDFDAESRQFILDAEVAPITALRLRGSYSQFDAESFATITRPETFVTETSFHDENGDATEAGVALLLAPVTLDASYARFENEGSIPFTMNRYRIRAEYEFHARLGVVLELAKDRYDEDVEIGRYNARRLGLFVRLRR